MKLVLTSEAGAVLNSLLAQLKDRYPASEPSFRAVASALIAQFGAGPSDLALRRLAEQITPPESKRKAWLAEIARITENATPEQLARLEKSVKKLHQTESANAENAAEIKQN